jgi:hypothetical protein
VLLANERLEAITEWRQRARKGMTVDSCQTKHAEKMGSGPNEVKFVSRKMHPFMWERPSSDECRNCETDLLMQKSRFAV